MVIVSYGTLKSASSFAWQIVDLHLKSSYDDNVSYMHHRNVGLPSLYHKEHFEISDSELEDLVKLLDKERIYHFKTHSVFNNIAFSKQSLPVLSETLNRYFFQGKVKVVGSIRDPREICLSAMDHARRKTSDGSFFGRLDHLDDTIPHVKRNFEKAIIWDSTGMVEWIPYDLVVKDPLEVNVIISQYLGFDPKAIEAQLNWLLSKKDRIVQFNKGKAKRHESELSRAELSKLSDIFSKEISFYESVKNRLSGSKTLFL